MLLSADLDASFGESVKFRWFLLDLGTIKVKRSIESVQAMESSERNGFKHLKENFNVASSRMSEGMDS